MNILQVFGSKRTAATSCRSWGPSGRGKSTLMNINGLPDRAADAACFLNGREIRAMNDGELPVTRNASIGFEFQ